MAASSAADGDRQIGLSFLLVPREQRLQQLPHPGEKRRKMRVALDMGCNGRVAPGKLFELRDVVRVVEKAHVESQIGISRYTVSIRERSDENTKTGRRKGKMAGYQPSQLGGAQIGGIDQEVSTVAQRGDYSAFEPDTIHYRTVAGEGVQPPVLGIAPL